MSKQNRDDCQLSGSVQHGGDFHNWIVFEGEDGHNVTYDLPKGKYQIGPDIEPLHTNTKYNYKLHSDCTKPDGDIADSCGWDQRLEDGGRTLACEDNIGGKPDSIDYRDLVITLDEGFGLWVPTSADSGYIDIPDKCGEPEAPPPPPPPTVGPIPPAANGGNGNCGGPGDFQCGATPEGCTAINVQSRMISKGVWTHDLGGASEIVSMEVINKDDEQNHRIIVEFASCLPSISENSCITGDLTALGAFQLENGIPDDDYGDIIKVLKIDVTQLNDTTYEFFFYGTIQQEPGTDGSESGINDKSFVPADWTFYCCEGAEGEGGVGGGAEDPNVSCSTSTILTTGYTDPEFFTHVFDPGIIRSVKVINPHDPNGRFLRITINPHVCDMDSIIETFCLCTSYDAFGDPIVEFGEITVTKVDDYTIDVVIKGKIIETQGNEG